MKTVREHLNDLREPERFEALKAMDRNMESQKHPTLADALFVAFNWGLSYHGAAYWKAIHDRLEAGTYFDASQQTGEECTRKAKEFMASKPATEEDYEQLEDIVNQSKPLGIFPEDDEERQKYAVGTFICEFFPHAIAELARFSYEMQQKHNPDAPMGWAKDKSVGDGNQIFRHQMDGEFREVAWRGLEQLERFLTKMEPFDEK